MENELEKKGLTNFLSDKTIKKGVIASLIATLIFIVVFEPLMNIIWKILNKTSIVIYSRFLDSIYKYAAYGHKNDIDFTLVFFVLLLFFMSFFALLMIRSLIRKERKEKQILDSIKDPAEKLKIMSERLEKTILKRKRFNLFDKYFMKISVVVLIISFFTFSLYLFKCNADLRLNTTFNQRVNAIAPFIDKHNKEILISNWALMESKENYLDIMKTIDSIATSKNLTLPKEFLK